MPPPLRAPAPRLSLAVALAALICLALALMRPETTGWDPAGTPSSAPPFRAHALQPERRMVLAFRLSAPSCSCERCPLPACTHKPCPPLPPSAGTPPLCAALMCKGPCLSKRNWSRLALNGASVIPEPLWQTRHGMSTPARRCSTGEMGFSCECRKSMRPWRSKSTAVREASRSR